MKKIILLLLLATTFAGTYTVTDSDSIPFQLSNGVTVTQFQCTADPVTYDAGVTFGAVSKNLVVDDNIAPLAKNLIVIGNHYYNNFMKGYSEDKLTKAGDKFIEQSDNIIYVGGYYYTDLLAVIKEFSDRVKSGEFDYFLYDSNGNTKVQIVMGHITRSNTYPEYQFDEIAGTTAPAVANLAAIIASKAYTTSGTVTTDVTSHGRVVFSDKVNQEMSLGIGQQKEFKSSFGVTKIYLDAIRLTDTVTPVVELTFATGRESKTVLLDLNENHKVVVFGIKVFLEDVYKSFVPSEGGGVFLRVTSTNSDDTLLDDQVKHFGVGQVRDYSINGDVITVELGSVSLEQKTAVLLFNGGEFSKEFSVGDSHELLGAEITLVNTLSSLVPGEGEGIILKVSPIKMTPPVKRDNDMQKTEVNIEYNHNPEGKVVDGELTLYKQPSNFGKFVYLETEYDYHDNIEIGVPSVGYFEGSDFEGPAITNIVGTPDSGDSFSYVFSFDTPFPINSNSLNEIVEIPFLGENYLVNKISDSEIKLVKGEEVNIAVAQTKTLLINGEFVTIHVDSIEGGINDILGVHLEITKNEQTEIVSLDTASNREATVLGTYLFLKRISNPLNSDTVSVLVGGSKLRLETGLVFPLNNDWKVDIDSEEGYVNEIKLYYHPSNSLNSNGEDQITSITGPNNYFKLEYSDSEAVPDNIAIKKFAATVIGTIVNQPGLKEKLVKMKSLKSKKVTDTTNNEKSNAATNAVRSRILELLAKLHKK